MLFNVYQNIQYGDQANAFPNNHLFNSFLNRLTDSKISMNIQKIKIILK